MTNTFNFPSMHTKLKRPLSLKGLEAFDGHLGAGDLTHTDTNEYPHGPLAAITIGNFESSFSLCGVLGEKGAVVVRKWGFATSLRKPPCGGRV